MIYLTSRYAATPAQFILDERSGVTRPTVMRGAATPVTASRIYRWRDGDRLDTLGRKFADKSSNWWMILDANSETIDPLSLVAGTSVVVG
jgi:hypothetical protein